MWSVPPGGPVGDGAPGSWGGHCAPIIAYSPHSLTCVTWGGLTRMTWEFFATYCDEGYAVLSQDWLYAEKVAPNGFDLTTLEHDLTAVTH